ncbi:hypothetical protein [Microcoleus sp. B3-D7]|uniref:hypothetical protein n=1 Tax=Microcoleus sp. B3-D7 TaxID=2818659 RepID=UPI002FD64E56
MSWKNLQRKTEMSIKKFLLIIKSKFTSSNPVTLEQINEILQKVNELEIKYQKLVEEVSTKLPTNTLTIVSQKPVSECGEILNALTKRRQHPDTKQCLDAFSKRQDVLEGNPSSKNDYIN